MQRRNVRRRMTRPARDAPALAAPSAERYTSGVPRRAIRGPMSELLIFLSQLISIYELIIIVSVIMSWLIGFGIVNPYNQIARTVWNFLQAITEPALRPIRRLLPDFGGIDISPIVLLIALQFLQRVILTNAYQALS